MAERLTQSVLAVIKSDPAFQDVFPTQIHKALEPGDDLPGLTITVHDCDDLSAHTLLVRCQPAFVPDRNRAVYGRLEFGNDGDENGWRDTVDLSTFSCKKGMTFFTDYPRGKAALHLSRLPLYELKVPEIFGVIKIHLLNAGKANPILEIENGWNETIHFGDVAIERHKSKQFNATEGLDRRLHCRGQSARIWIYAEPVHQSQEPYFIPEPATIQLHGITLANRLDRTGLTREGPFSRAYRAHKPDEDVDLRAAGQITRNGYVVSVQRTAGVETHLLAGSPTYVDKGNQQPLQLAAEQATFREGPLPSGFRAWEEDADNLAATFIRLDFNRDGIRNAAMLLDDHYENIIDHVQIPRAGHKVRRVELARCDMRRLNDPLAHLYLIETAPVASGGSAAEGGIARAEGPTTGWLFCAGGIEVVRDVGLDQSLPNEGGDTLFGPLANIADRTFRVAWNGEADTPVSFDIPDHEDQVKAYFWDGFFSLTAGAAYRAKGNLNGELQSFQPGDPIRIQSEEFRFRDYQNGGVFKGMNFDPRAFASFFEKDSYRIRYSGEQQSFVVCAGVRAKRQSVTPKTLFLLIPEGGRAVLGSHALAPVKFAGVNYLVLPGLTFKLSQGPVYYS
jgi:hypothetical protein